MSEFPGITHVALTVSDLSVSVPWYREQLTSLSTPGAAGSGETVSS